MILNEMVAFEIKKPLISICISTFNRCEKVNKLVNSILTYKGEEIEVIVADNGSTDDTALLLSKIKDHRFFFIESNKNVGPLLNGLKVLSLATAQYAFICLDKDNIDYNSIKNLINRLKDNEDIVFGYCSLNLKVPGRDIIYEKGFSTLFNMAYLSRHPTGTFYKTDIFKNLPMLKNISEEQRSFSFYMDLVNAEMAMTGKSRLINLPAFYTERKEEARNTPSFTYNANNLYFSPAKRLVEFEGYLDSAQKLQLSSYEIFRLIWKLYGQELTLSTFGYKNMIGDYDVCAHHGISTRKVSLLEIWKLNFTFSSHFFQKQLDINIFQKILIVLYGHTKVLVKSFL